ncbi:MAG: hypothetical protein M9949_06245 [Candidatus Kapabacteria bacterium]|nr:hypothetical protein [Candidatus Kapabacteria bacterium]
MSVPKIQAVNPETGKPLFLDPATGAPSGTDGQTLRFNSGDELEATSAITVTIAETYKETNLTTDMDAEDNYVGASLQLRGQIPEDLGLDLENSYSSAKLKVEVQRPLEGIESCGIEIKSRNLAEPQSESEILFSGDKFNVNNMQLHNALLEAVETLPSGLTMDDAGRIVRLGSGFYFWQGWRWVGLSDNKYHFKPSNQILAKDNIWYDDNNIQFEIGPLELYEFKLIVDVKLTTETDMVAYWGRFSSSETINEMRGSRSMFGVAEYDGGEDHWHNMLAQSNYFHETKNAFTGMHHYIFHFDGIIYGGNATSTIKLQHKATGATGIIDVRPFTRIILKRIY